MRSFEELFALAARRKGGPEALEALLPRPKSAAALARLGDDRWLAGMTKCVFQAGFNWKVVEAMWPGFETVFEGFDVHRLAMLSDDDIGRLVSDSRIVRHGAKIAAVRDNAIFLTALAAERGSAAKVFARWPACDYVGLLGLLKTRGSRLGGATAQYFLRQIGKDSFILSKDLTAALIREGVADKAPSSKAALAAVQGAFNGWMDESGRGLTQISRVLALSVGP